ncbi:hypothetical protein ACS0TY_022177 [Phlomoides rotata]
MTRIGTRYPTFPAQLYVIHRLLVPLFMQSVRPNGRAKYDLNAWKGILQETHLSLSSNCSPL